MSTDNDDTFLFSLRVSRRQHPVLYRWLSELPPGSRSVRLRLLCERGLQTEADLLKAPLSMNRAAPSPPPPVPASPPAPDVVRKPDAQGKAASAPAFEMVSDEELDIAGDFMLDVLAQIERETSAR